MTVGEDVRQLQLKERRRLLSCGGVLGDLEDKEKRRADNIRKRALVGSYEVP
jgi:hypothetical protein